LLILKQSHVAGKHITSKKFFTANAQIVKNTHNTLKCCDETYYVKSCTRLYSLGVVTFLCERSDVLWLTQVRKCTACEVITPFTRSSKRRANV